MALTDFLLWCSVVFYVVAACPHGINFRFEWLATACLVLALSGML